MGRLKSGKPNFEFWAHAGFDYSWKFLAASRQLELHTIFISNSSSAWPKPFPLLLNWIRVMIHWKTRRTCVPALLVSRTLALSTASVATARRSWSGANVIVTRTTIWGSLGLVLSCFDCLSWWTIISNRNRCSFSHALDFLFCALFPTHFPLKGLLQGEWGPRARAKSISKLKLFWRARADPFTLKEPFQLKSCS